MTPRAPHTWLLPAGIALALNALLGGTLLGAALGELLVHLSRWFAPVLVAMSLAALGLSLALPRLRGPLGELAQGMALGVVAGPAGQALGAWARSGEPSLDQSSLLLGSLSGMSSASSIALLLAIARSMLISARPGR